MEKKDKLRVIAIAIGLLAISLAFYLYTFPILNSPPNPQATYGFISNNFNTSINSSTNLQILKVNTTFQVNGTTYSWLQGKNIYYIGGEFCPYCASYSYIFSKAFSGSIPKYNSSFYTAEGDVPAIPISAIASMTPPDNFTFNYAENPINATTLGSYPPNELSNMTEKWLSSQLPILQLLAKGGTIPEVYIANTQGNTTYICNGYVGLPISIYNSTSASQFAGYDMVGVPYNSYLPSPYGLNLNYNLLVGCINKINNEFG
jgi:hypothetical protein